MQQALRVGDSIGKPDLIYVYGSLIRIEFVHGHRLTRLAEGPSTASDTRME